MFFRHKKRGVCDLGLDFYFTWATDVFYKVLYPAAPDKDVNNPDPALRNQKLVGVRILSGLQRKDGRWDDGEAYDPKAGRSYRARIALASPDRLDVTGCVLFVCRIKHWTRVGKDRNR